jgi:hypothetical protein
LNPPASALTSLDAWRSYQQAVWFPGLPDTRRFEPYIRELVVVQPNGTVRPRLSDSLQGEIFGMLLKEHRDYTRIHAPALAIYATTFLDTTHGDAAQRAKIAAWEQKYMAPFRAASIARVKKELPHSEVLTVPGTHNDFIFNSRAQIVSAMRKFLE